MYKPLIEFNACLPQGFFISTDSLFGFLVIMISKNTATHPVSHAGKMSISFMGSCLVIDIYGGDGGLSWIVAYNHHRPLFMSNMFCRKVCILFISADQPVELMFIQQMPQQMLIHRGVIE